MFYNYKAIYQKTGWYTWNWIFKLRAIDDDGFSILLIVICLLAFGCVMKIFIHIRSLIKKINSFAISENSSEYRNGKRGLKNKNVLTWQHKSIY